MKAIESNKTIFIVWITLLVLTCLAWSLANIGIPIEQKVLTPILIIVGWVKMWLVIHHYMEIKEAPPVLKGLCNGWVVLSCIPVISMFYILPFLKKYVLIYMVK